MITITGIKFTNYKTFKSYNVPLTSFNIMVGPNNAGKSTIIGALKLLSEGIKKANSRKPSFIRDLNDNLVLGYELDLNQSPIAIENVFYNYDDTTPAVVRFSLSNNAFIQVFFPSAGICLMNIDAEDFTVRSPLDFKKFIGINIGFVPILSPVENHEQLFQKEAARLAISSSRASRNFRNIWYHYGEDFEEFRELVNSTWPGMDISRPETAFSQSHTTLNMFCPEDRIPREMFWAGYGFQIWCQMLTYIIKNKDASLFIIDEPDIYLHSDLQRQLLGILKELGPDIVIATHSTEIITEAEINDILIINKAYPKAKRIKDPSQLRTLFNVLGSNLNPVLTQIAKTKRVLFVEGKDFAVFSKIARILNYKQLANRADFAVVPVEGFNPTKLKMFKEGIEKTIGSNILSAVIFDRDYRSAKEVEFEMQELEKDNYYSHIHSCKELENILLIPGAIQAAINQRICDYNKRTKGALQFNENIVDLLTNLSNNFKPDVQAQLQSHRMKFERSINKGIDDSVFLLEIINDFDLLWSRLDTRLTLVPGKEFLSHLNRYLQANYSISLSSSNIISNLNKDNLTTDVINLIANLNNFRQERVPS
jgi:AAA15 family ATPase/GTPase